MKITYIVPAFSTGGAEKFLVSVANGLVNNHTVQEVISLSDNNPLAGEFDPSIRFTAMPRKSKLSLDTLSALRRHLSSTSPDIIFCLNFFSFAFFRLATLGMRIPARTYISYHNTEQVSAKEENLHKLYFKMVRKRDTVLMVCGNQMKYTLQKYSPKGSRHNYIYNGIDCNYWTPPPAEFDRTAARQQCGLPATGKIIILTAAFRKEKNHAGAVRALKQYHDRYEDKPFLLFVGAGAESDAVRKSAQELGLSDHVIFAGLQKDVRPFYWCSDLFTLTSTSVETFSIAALEAMACGLPAVLTNIGGADEMVIPGRNGALSTTDPSSIAQQWQEVLHAGFSAKDIQAFIRERFDKGLMISKYQKEFGL